MRPIFLFLLSAVLAVKVGAQSVFDMPGLFPQHKRFLSQFVTAVGQNNLIAAETAVRSALKVFPNDANWNYNLACVLARDSRADEALTHLETAIRCGFTDTAKLDADTDLETLRGLPRYAELKALAEQLTKDPPRNPTLSTALPTEGTAGTEITVDALNTMWNWDPAQGGYFTTRFDLKPYTGTTPYTGPYAELIAPWIAEGSAAGNAGDLYVNRDEDRCAVRFECFPGLTPVLYGAEATARGAHLNQANGLFVGPGGPLPIIGNTTSAINPPPFWRSLPRLISTDASQTVIALRLAMANQLYVYDATLDHIASVRGDLLVSANPSIILSGDTLSTDRPNPVEAQRGLTELILAALAAMPPDTKAEMLRRGLLVPTVQMLLRGHVIGAKDYFTPEAHPTVFDPRRINGEALIRAAHALRPEMLPPFFQLAVRGETMPVPNVEFFDLAGSEGMVDTPVCVSRIRRGRDYTKSVTLQAVMPTTKIREYRWFVVSGNPEKIRFHSRSSDNALMTVDIDWHGQYMGRDGMECRRVDVACVAVADNGALSAPAFYSLRFLGNERRVYATDEGKRLLSVDYAPDPVTGLRYEDPILSAQKNWQDFYHYDADGRLKGWFRRRAAKDPEQFDTQGRRVTASAPDGTPRAVVPVKYTPRFNQQGDSLRAPALELIQSDAGDPTELPR